MTTTNPATTTTSTTPREWDVWSHPEWRDKVRVPRTWPRLGCDAIHPNVLAFCTRRRRHTGRHHRALFGVVLAVWGGDDQ